MSCLMMTMTSRGRTDSDMNRYYTDGGEIEAEVIPLNDTDVLVFYIGDGVAEAVRLDSIVINNDCYEPGIAQLALIPLSEVRQPLPIRTDLPWPPAIISGAFSLRGLPDYVAGSDAWFARQEDTGDE